MHLLKDHLPVWASVTNACCFKNVLHVASRWTGPKVRTFHRTSSAFMHRHAKGPCICTMFCSEMLLPDMAVTASNTSSPYWAGAKTTQATFL